MVVLSCAVSQRIDTAAPVHGVTQSMDIEQVLQPSARACDVPEAEVDRLARKIARKRTETDLRIAATRGTDWQEFGMVMAAPPERGTMPAADAVRNKQEAVLGQLQDGRRRWIPASCGRCCAGSTAASPARRFAISRKGRERPLNDCPTMRLGHGREQVALNHGGHGECHGDFRMSETMQIAPSNRCTDRLAVAET